MSTRRSYGGAPAGRGLDANGMNEVGTVAARMMPGGTAPVISHGGTGPMDPAAQDKGGGGVAGALYGNNGGEGRRERREQAGALARQAFGVGNL
jgi:hypothetical protein